MHSKNLGREAATSSSCRDEPPPSPDRYLFESKRWTREGRRREERRREERRREERRERAMVCVEVDKGLLKKWCGHELPTSFAIDPPVCMEGRLVGDPGKKIRPKEGMVSHGAQSVCLL